MSGTGIPQSEVSKAMNGEFRPIAPRPAHVPFNPLRNAIAQAMRSRVVEPLLWSDDPVRLDTSKKKQKRNRGRPRNIPIAEVHLEIDWNKPVSASYNESDMRDIKGTLEKLVSLYDCHLKERLVDTKRHCRRLYNKFDAVVDEIANALWEWEIRNNLKLPASKDVRDDAVSSVKSSDDDHNLKLVYSIISQRFHRHQPVIDELMKRTITIKESVELKERYTAVQELVEISQEPLEKANAECAKMRTLLFQSSLAVESVTEKMTQRLMRFLRLELTSTIRKRPAAFIREQIGELTPQTAFSNEKTQSGVVNCTLSELRMIVIHLRDKLGIHIHLSPNKTEVLKDWANPPRKLSLVFNSFQQMCSAFNIPSEYKRKIFPPHAAHGDQESPVVYFFGASLTVPAANQTERRIFPGQSYQREGQIGSEEDGSRFFCQQGTEWEMGGFVHPLLFVKSTKQNRRNRRNTKF